MVLAKRTLSLNLVVLSTVLLLSYVLCIMAANIHTGKTLYYITPLPPSCHPLSATPLFFERVSILTYISKAST